MLYSIVYLPILYAFVRFFALKPSYLLLSPLISSYLLLSPPISSYLLSPISSYLLLSPPISSYLLLSPPISSYLLLSPPISSNRTYIRNEPNIYIRYVPQFVTTLVCKQNLPKVKLIVAIALTNGERGRNADFSFYFGFQTQTLVSFCSNLYKKPIIPFFYVSLFRVSLFTQPST